MGSRSLERRLALLLATIQGGDAAHSVGDVGPSSGVLNNGLESHIVYSAAPILATAG